jgi:glycosyltransferase involved in cell wall biosynthesis
MAAPDPASPEGGRPRLLVTTSTFPEGPGDHATPPFVLQLCEQLALDYDVDVLAPHVPGAAREERLGAVRVLRYRYAPQAWEVLGRGGGILPGLRSAPWRLALVPLFLLAQAWALRKALSRVSYRAIHAHWLLPQGLVAALVLLTLARRPPLVCTAHGADVYALPGRLATGLRRWVAARAAAITAVSQATRQTLETQTGTRVQVAPMGVDLRQRFAPATLERTAGALLFVGRLVEKKGVATLLDALPETLRGCPAAHLTVVGSGPEEASLRAQAAALGVAGRVDFRGAVANAELPPLYRRAQIVVFPSVVARSGDQEGLGLVAVEALGCGCAVVASDLGPVRDVIEDGKTGLLAAPGDPAALARQLLRLLGDPALRDALGHRGRAHALARFDWAVAARTYRALLDGLAR